ncbi:MAG TPA: hypothetical protein VD902_14065, partial [Symbiobacteriaceae bacterium]|nr:hypothetical protein [Symbiobacteriaceae bacterium]
YGDAVHRGDMKGRPLNKPMQGIRATPQGGYWLFAGDGGVFCFGPGADFHGSAVSEANLGTVTAFAPAPNGRGYWMVNWSGRVFSRPSGDSEWLEFGGHGEVIRLGTNQDGRLEVFVKNAVGEMWQRWQLSPGGPWSDWLRMGNGIVSSFDVGRTRDGRLVVFGVGTDWSIWRTAQVRPNDVWTAWERLPGTQQVKSVTVANGPDGLLELFAIGLADNKVFHRWEATPAGAWSPWERWGAVLDYAQCMTAARNYRGELQIFKVGPLNRVYDMILPPPPSNKGYYRIGWNLDIKGLPAGSWSEVRQVPGWWGHAAAGAGAAMADLNGNGRPDLVLFHIENPEGENEGYYRIGWDLDRKGYAQSWTEPKQVPGWFGGENQGGGVAVADLNGNGRPDLIIFHIDNPAGENRAFYRIGWDLDAAGNPTSWSPLKQVPGWFGAENQGSAITVADLNGDGRPELLVYFVDNRAPYNKGFIRIGWNLDAAGNAAFWSELFEVPTNLYNDQAGVGIAVGNFTLGTVAEFLRDARYTWERSIENVPRAGNLGPAHDVAGILGMEPNAGEYAGRSVLGGDYVDYLTRFMRMPVNDVWWHKQGNMARLAVEDMGLGLSQRHARSLFAREYFLLGAPRVQAAIPSPTALLEPNYLTDLLDSTHTGIKSRPDLGEKTPLLYLLMRHGLLLEYLNAAYRIQRKHDTLSGVTPEGPWLEPELVDINPEPSWLTKTVWRRLSRVAGRLDARSIGTYLDSVKATVATGGSPTVPPDFFHEVQPFIQFCRSLKELRDLPAATLDQLLAEGLDLCTYRIDAWITALAAQRLQLKREGGQAGRTYIGAYGWVEDLTPASARTSDGFVHAPSYSQAAASAILRSGFLSHHAPGQENPFAVDLSSTRVRLALSLLDGMREGQPLGALLGYRFERALHERMLDQYIQPFRRLAPVPGVGPQPGTAAQETVAVSNVVDGLELHRRWKKGTAEGWNADSIPWGDAAAMLPGATTPDAQALLAELDQLDDALDTVNDAILAEAVYQMVQGNPQRAGAMLDLIGKWDSPPPELEVLSTPRSSTAHTHRLMLLLPPAGGGPPAGWPVVSPRAQAEPLLNAWAARYFG